MFVYKSFAVRELQVAVKTTCILIGFFKKELTNNESYDDITICKYYANRLLGKKDQPIKLTEHTTNVLGVDISYFTNQDCIELNLKTHFLLFGFGDIVRVFKVSR